MNNLEMHFAQVIQIFFQAGMQGLGKMPNPVTNSIEINLEQAKSSIDLLGMLKEKTKGNLSNNETQMLEMALSQLRLNYVDGMAKQ